ncbi:DoxX family protein [Pedobacter arcticus]|uniref:DoxX family protein n=1 Tax=Pedobacter arcticus TaxID=752140 RepID=UPI0002FB8335|nr:MauE/DoxX family redox-associated membrane protein [Pedobacter arcticus]
MKKHRYAILMACIYISAGINHLVNPKFYLQIMPSYLPIHLQLVYLSGLAEIIAGALLLSKQTRKIGAWCIIVLLIAVFPANIQMSIDQYNVNGWLFYLSLIRLPFQFLLIYWAWIFTRN